MSYSTVFHSYQEGDNERLCGLFGKGRTHHVPPLPAIENFSSKYVILSKIYADEGGI